MWVGTFLPRALQLLLMFTINKCLNAVLHWHLILPNGLIPRGEGGDCALTTCAEDASSDERDVALLFSDLGVFWDSWTWSPK
mgnify:CR=1 FL=1